MQRAGNDSGALEARSAIAALGNIMTKDEAHVWLNRAVAAGIVGKSIEDAEAREWGLQNNVYVRRSLRERSWIFDGSRESGRSDGVFIWIDARAAQSGLFLRI